MVENRPLLLDEAGRSTSRHGIQVNDHFICSISRRNWVFQLADLRRVLMLPLDLLARRRPSAKRRTTAMFFGAVAGAVARQVVFELDVEHPMHALDAPMAARSCGEPFDVERRG